MITRPLQLLRDCIEKGLNFEEFQKRSSVLFDCEKASPKSNPCCQDGECQWVVIVQRMMGKMQFLSNSPPAQPIDSVFATAMPIYRHEDG